MGSLPESVLTTCEPWFNHADTSSRGFFVQWMPCTEVRQTTSTPTYNVLSANRPARGRVELSSCRHPRCITEIKSFEKLLK